MIDVATLQRTRQTVAADVIRMDSMRTPHLGPLRTNVMSPAAWDAADDAFRMLSEGQQVIYGWVRTQVWSHQPYPSVSVVDAIDRCGTDEERQIVAAAFRTFYDLALAEAGLIDLTTTSTTEGAAA